MTSGVAVGKGDEIVDVGFTILGLYKTLSTFWIANLFFRFHLGTPKLNIEPFRIM